MFVTNAWAGGGDFPQQAAQKAFDWCGQSVWHEGLCFFNRVIGIQGTVICIIVGAGTIVMWKFKAQIRKFLLQLLKES